ncbi:hypothetical protein HPB50_022646 [Hyalomma asiaticum]|uniref:Uncharacterized protein n=1 Tax=Hyalomma asiaticum TaxID=266040 RepID=A0ACB7RYJ8_HYAAI|nr:hypothetical protein HPB50_022646 [Hyalomma asiaticum]
MDSAQGAFTAALTLATMCSSWLGTSGTARNLTTVDASDYSKYRDLVNLGIVRGSSRAAYFDVLSAIQTLRIYTAKDTVVWASVDSIVSNCSTTVPYSEETCHRDDSKTAKDTVVWASVDSIVSNCSTTMPYSEETCQRDDSKDPRTCSLAIYIGPYGIHLSTQYYECLEQDDRLTLIKNKT